jgi:hypothetical protein
MRLRKAHCLLVGFSFRLAENRLKTAR